MFRIFFRYLLSMTIAAALGFMGVHFVIYGVAPWSNESNVSLSISIRGTKNQAVPNAQLYVYAPQKRHIGVTDAQGNFEGIVKAKRGQVAVIEAVGPTFQIRKDVPIPRKPTYKSVIRLDSKEAALGHITLLSKSIEDMSKGLNAKPLQVNNTSLPAEKNQLTNPDTENATASEIRVEVSEERARTEHRMTEAATLLRESIQQLQKELFKKGVSTVRLRPLTAEDSFLEVIGLTKQGDYVSSSLIKCKLINKEIMLSAVASIIRPYSTNLENKTLRVYTSEPEKSRAYINGTPLPRTIQNTYAEFRIIKPQTQNGRIAIAATADGRPLVRKIARAEALLKLVEWHMPEPALSRR
jgi:hypothetical protein